MRVGIILSGGVGSRVGGDIPKQYIEVGGRPIISYVIETLAGCVDCIQIVASEEWRNLILNVCKDISDRLCANPEECMKEKINPVYALGRVKFSDPGLTRQFSIYNALKDIEKYASSDDIVIIHDAARPLATRNLCERCFIAIEQEEHEGALPVIPVKDTLYFSMDGIAINNLLDRTKIWAGQAPEAFVFGRYLKANERLIEHTWEAGGDCIVAPTSEIFRINGSTEPAKLAGMDVIMIEGEDCNYKITTPEDLARFREGITHNE